MRRMRHTFKGFEVVCQNRYCKKRFVVYSQEWNLSKTKKFTCCRSCWSEAYRQRHFVTKSCMSCGKPISRPKSKMTKRPTCSHECRNRMMVGSTNWRWNDDRILTYHGYVRIRTGPQQYVLEHRAVMEKKLGRKLLAGEAVHHKDENRTNNDPDNLELCASHGRHSEDHHTLERDPKSGRFKKKRT